MQLKYKLALVLCLLVCVLSVWAVRVLPGRTFNAGSSVDTLVFNSSGQLIIGAAASVRIVDAVTLKQQYVLNDAAAPATIVQQGRYIAAEYDDKQDGPQYPIGIWDIETGRLVTKLLGHTRGVTALAFNRDGSLLTSASADRTVRIWRMSDMQQLYVLTQHTDWVMAVAFSPDDSVLASSGLDNVINFWRVSDGSLQQSTKTQAVFALAYSPDGQTLAAVGTSTEILLLDAKTGQRLRSLVGHTDFINAVAWSSDGQYIVSGSGSIEGPREGPDSSVRIWRSSTGELLETHLQQLSFLFGAITTSVAVSPDNTTVVAGDRKGKVRMWSLP